MDVYVVEETCASQNWIRGVFSTLERARLFCAENEPQGAMVFEITMRTIDMPESWRQEDLQPAASAKD